MRPVEPYSPLHMPRKIEFITEPDVTGMGRIVVDGKFYGLPVDVVVAFKQLTDSSSELVKMLAPLYED